MSEGRGRAWRWAGLLLGGLATFWWVVAVVGGILSGPGAQDRAGADLEGIGVVVMVLANAAAYLVGCVRERLGAWLLMATGAAFCVFAFATAGRMQLFAMAVSGAPFLASGALFRVASARRESSVDGASR